MSNKIWLWKIGSTSKTLKNWKNCIVNNIISCDRELTLLDDLKKNNGDLRQLYIEKYKDGNPSSKANSIVQSCLEMLNIESGDTIVVYKKKTNGLYAIGWAIATSSYKFDEDKNNLYPHYVEVEMWNLVDSIPFKIVGPNPKSFLKGYDRFNDCRNFQTILNVINKQ